MVPAGLSDAGLLLFCCFLFDRFGWKRIGKTGPSGWVRFELILLFINEHFCRLEVAAGAVSGRSVRFELNSSRFVENGVGQALDGTARDVDRRVN